MHKIRLLCGSIAVTIATHKNSKIQRLSEFFLMRIGACFATLAILSYTKIIDNNWYLRHLFSYFLLGIQWGTKNVGGLPTPWKWVYPCAFTNNPIGCTLTRVTGVSCFSEITQEITTTYLTWIDQDYMGSSGGGDTINLIVIGW